MSTEEVKPMKGWKTKTGAILLSVGAFLSSTSELIQDPDIFMWMDFAGKTILGLGTSLTAWGLGHKLDKNKKTPLPPGTALRPSFESSIVKK
jgi:hypothetical protein